MVEMKEAAGILVAMILALSLTGNAFTESVSTGEGDVSFSSASSNDPPGTVDPGYDKDVGCTTVAGVGTKTLTVTVTNGYPCYSSRVDYSITNTGTTPVEVQGIDVDENLATPGSQDIPEIDVTVTGIQVGDQIDPGQEKSGDLEMHVNQCAGEGIKYGFTVTILLEQGTEDNSPSPNGRNGDHTPPPAPSLLSPADGQNLTDNTPLFDWSDVSDPSGVIYTLLVAADDGFNSIVLQKTDISTSYCQISPGEELPWGVYYWRVRAVDGAGNVGPWSEAWSFTLAPSTISHPSGFVVDSLIIRPQEVAPGEEVAISVMVRNTGEVGGTYAVTLRINGVFEDGENVTLAGGENTRVMFTVTRDREGDYDVNVNGLTGSFRVIASDRHGMSLRLGVGMILIPLIIIAIILMIAARRRIASRRR